MNSLIRVLIASAFLSLLDIRPCLSETLDDQLKTAYVLNFIKFTEWPDAATDSTITLCVAGKKTLGGALATLHGRKAGSRELHVIHYSTEKFNNLYQSADKPLEHCQVIFIGASAESYYIPLLKSLAEAPVLLISDIDDFAEQGGAIGLAYRESRIIFEVNLASVQKAKLRLSGQFLNLASQIYRK